MQACHQPCRYAEFSKTITTSTLDDQSLDQVLEIAFDSLATTIIEQQFAISATVFVSNLGLLQKDILMISKPNLHKVLSQTLVALQPPGIAPSGPVAPD